MAVVESLGAYPRPWTHLQRKHMGWDVSESRVTQDGQFTQDGGFRLVRRWSWHGGNYWGSNVLRHDPEQHRLKATKSGLLYVYEKLDPWKEPIYTIDPGNLRKVDQIRSTQSTVTDSGLVLPNVPYPLSSGLQGFTQEEALQMIEQGETGPLAGQTDFFVKVVNPNLRGTEVFLLYFDSIPSQLKGDAVVIDMSNRQLVERQIIYPFLTDKQYTDQVDAPAKLLESSR